MSTEKKTDPPPYFIQVQGEGQTKVYHVHTPFTPPVIEDTLVNQPDPPKQERPVYTDRTSTTVGFEPGRTYCSTCQTDVMTNVTYKAGLYAWLMCLLFICFGLVLCCCLIPFFVNRFKDAYHTCPRCNKILHVEKRKCCK